MKRAEPTLDPRTVQELVLARVLVRPKGSQTRADVVRSVAAAICPPLSASAAREAAQSAFADCERAQWIQVEKAAGRSRALRPVVASKARPVVAALFGSAPKSWEQAQRAVALSRLGRAPAGRKDLGVDTLAALILAETHDVPGSVKTLPATVDYLAWRALGVETTKPFRTEAVKRHLLRELVPADVRVDTNIWRRMLAMRALRADGHDAQSLTRGLLAIPAKRAGSTEMPSRTLETPRAPTNTNDPRPAPQPTLADFAAAVQKAARLPTVARFHDDRAFIGSVWDHMRGRRPVGDMTLSDFKQRLIAAHRDGLVRITRADLVGVMDRSLVERSEARFLDATFHFVALEAGGMR
jgi:hypothetical protein